LSTRPHTTHEIADLEISVEYEGDVFRVDLVIKSGAEIPTQIKESEVWHQISRPLDYDSDLVVLISYADLTIPLKNRIRKHEDSVDYIVNEELAHLLKIYNELT